MQGEGRRPRTRKIPIPPPPTKGRQLRSGVAPVGVASRPLTFAQLAQGIPPWPPPPTASLTVPELGGSVPQLSPEVHARQSLDWDHEDLATRIYDRPSLVSMQEVEHGDLVEPDGEVTRTAKIMPLELELLRRRLKSDDLSEFEQRSQPLRGRAQMQMTLPTIEVSYVAEDDSPPQSQARQWSARGRGRALAAVLTAAACGFLVVRYSRDPQPLRRLADSVPFLRRQEYDAVVVPPQPSERAVAEARLKPASSAANLGFPGYDVAGDSQAPGRGLSPSGLQERAITFEPAAFTSTTGQAQESPSQPTFPQVRSHAPGEALAEVREESPSRAALRTPAAPGVLRINTRPWAEIYIDGQRVGNTPQMHLELTAGWHRISLRNPELELVKAFTIKIAPGQTETRILDM